MAYPNQPDWQPVAVPAPNYVHAEPINVYPAPTNGMAIAALILAFVFYPVGIVLGHVARRQISRTHEGGRGLATAALIIGYLQLAATVGVAVVATLIFLFAAK